MTEKKAQNPLTPAGYQKLHEEHAHLWKKVRPEVVKRIADAAAEGDRSENAEYIYGKKRLRELDSRIRYLSSLLDNARVVDPESLAGDTVRFGATVELVDEADLSVTWTIVGVGEADPALGTISLKSPLAMALLGKGIGEEVAVQLPDGKAWYEIENVYFGTKNVG